MERTRLFNGDCMQIMSSLPGGQVRLVLADLPYGVTQNKWDCELPLPDLWREYLRLITPDATLAFTATQPFTSKLVMSQPAYFKYDWTWRKPKGTGHLNAKRQPMRDKEDILIFAPGQSIYNPQMTAGEPYKARGGKRNDDTYGQYTSARNDNEGLRYPKQVIDFPIVERDKDHPSQKPVELLRFLIRTYTNPGDIVLDNTMGAGSTGVAALAEGRRFIGIELDRGYFDAAARRIGPVEPRDDLFAPAAPETA